MAVLSSAENRARNASNWSQKNVRCELLSGVTKGTRRSASASRSEPADHNAPEDGNDQRQHAKEKSNIGAI